MLGLAMLLNNVTCISPRSKMFTEFILNVPAGLLTVQKLYCLIEIVHSDLFTQHGEWIPGNSEIVRLFRPFSSSALRRRGGLQLKEL